MSKFDPEQPLINVQQITNPGRRGVTTGRVRSQGTRTFVEVEVGPHDRTFIDFNDLELLKISSGGIKSLLEDLRFGKVGDLARILTYHKISSNLSNVFYAMQASRTDFYAYQFKPVYKFIESLNNRILITDEVGLGKTIEAGLIWLEAKARSDARRLLVICPSMLRDKWKQELRFRFNVNAEVYDSRGLISMLDDFKREGVGFQCAAVCSLQSFRQDSVQIALSELENTPNRFDLVVIDEAHHLRNVDTKSHRAGRTISDLTDSLVLLTATPLHLRSEDLFRLLSLLDADEFNNPTLFEQRLIANEPVIQAQNALRHYPANVKSALSEIESLRKSNWFKENPLVDLMTKKLSSLDPENHAEMVEVGRLLENMNLLGSFISRTRKREVQEWRVIREPVVINVQLNEREKEFYDTVTEAVQNRVHNFHGNAIAAFALMMPQRQMASCIPAMVQHYSLNPLEDEEIDEGLLAELEFPTEDENWVGNNISGISPSLQSLVDSWKVETPDSKFVALIGALRQHFENESDSKVIIFSYFKKTLAYLSRCLEDAGYATVVIHGDVPMEERQERIEHFKTKPQIRILLSSEVGAEGIDLQFCHVLINYDLPWNPMKVEQRIGRVDRLGQKAKKISVINFAVQDTIEEKILKRLYDRIDIFRRSIGELEPILGKIIQELTVDLLSQSLTAEQIEARIIQTQRAIEEKRQSELELVEQSAVFLGASDYILERIGQARELGRWITPEDLMSFIKDYFNNSYRGTSISWNKPTEGLVTIKLSNDARNDLAHFCRMQASGLSTELMYPNSKESILAFRADVAQENPRIELLTHFHPLVRWIIDEHKKKDSAFFPVTAVELKGYLVPPGQYLVVIEFWHFYGIRQEVQIAYSVSPIGNSDMPKSVSAESLVQAILEKGTSWEHADQMIDKDALMIAWENCTETLFVTREDSFHTYKQKTVALRQRRKAHLESFLTRKKDALQKAIETMRTRHAPQNQIKGFQTRLANLDEEYKDKIRQLEIESRTRDEFKEIATVLCRSKN